MTVNADVSAGDVILGSQTLSGLSASVRATPGLPLKTRFSAGLPGQSRLTGDGDLETGAAAKFKGAIDFSSGDLAALGAWANQGEAGFGAKIVALGEALENRSASLSGDVEVSAVGLSGRSLRIALDRSMLTGALAFTSPVGTDPGRLFMDLSSDLLDVEALPSVNASAALIGDLDLSLSLRANALHVARVGDTQVSSGSLFLKVAKAGPKISLDRLSLSNLGGASVDAEGAYGPDGLTATGRLSAERLGDFAVLVSRLAPADWSRKLAERAPLLSPAALAFEAHGRSASGASLNSLTASGRIGQTRASFSLDTGPKGDGQIVRLDLDAPDSSALLHQLGLGGTTTPSGRGHIGLHAAGAWGASYDGDASGALAGVDLSARGRFLPAAEGDDARLFGSVKLKGANVVPLASTLGLAPSGGAIGPVEANADVTLRGERWTISHLAATVAGVRASGDLAYEPPAEAAAAPLISPDLSLAEDAVNGPATDAAEPPAPIAGELSFDRLPGADLLALALGPPQPSHPGPSWSDAKFAAAPLSPPPIAVRVNVGTLDLGDSLAAQEFSTMLRLDRGRLDFDELAMKVLGAAASGQMTLRRDRETATLTGTLEAGAMQIAQPGFSGRVGGRLDFASTGKTPAALISGLAGAGAADFAGVELNRMNPAALDEVVARAQAPEAQLDETNIAYEFSKALDTRPLPIPDGSTPVLLSAGAIKLGPLAIARPRAAGSFSASLDLATLALETRLALTAPSTGLKFWSGPPPTATITVHDALGAPKRRVDVAALSAGLATQAIGRESDRIAALEADIRERAFFNRRLKGERFMDKRAAEIEDWRAEHARLKELAEHLEAERAQAEKAAAEKAAADKAAAEVANEKAVAIKPELPPDLPADVAPGADRRGIRGPGRRAAAAHAAQAAPLAGRSDRKRALLSGCYRTAFSSSTKTRSADDRLASPRAVSTEAASAFTERPRSAAMSRKRRQKASSSETLVRWPAMTSERFTTRAFAPSRVIGAGDFMRLEAALGLVAFVFQPAPLRRGHPEQDLVLGGLGLLAPPLFAFPLAAQIDDIPHRRFRRYFLRKASIETTFPGPSAGFSAGTTGFAAEGGGLAEAAGSWGSGRSVAGFGRGASSLIRGSSLNPNGTDGSEKPVIASNGTVRRSGLREKLRLTSKASCVTTRSQNSCCRMIDISSGNRPFTAAGTTTPGARVLKAMLK